MKKYSLLLIALLCFLNVGEAAKHRYRPHNDRNKSIVSSHQRTQYLGIGLRGGAALPFVVGADVKVPMKIGMNGDLDIQYSIYKHQKKVSLGVMTGLTAGCQEIKLPQESVAGGLSSLATGVAISYDQTKVSDVVEKQQQIFAEVPVMFALRGDKGFFLNVGPSFAFPVLTRNLVSFKVPEGIKAEYTDYGVTLNNELISGRITAEDQNTEHEVKWIAPFVNVKVGLQLGGSFNFKRKGALDLGIFVDCAVKSIYQKKNAVSASFMQVSNPDEVQPSVLTYTSPSSTFAKNLMIGTAGIKLMYQIPLRR